MRAYCFAHFLTALSDTPNIFPIFVQELVDKSKSNSRLSGLTSLRNANFSNEQIRELELVYNVIPGGN